MISLGVAAGRVADNEVAMTSLSSLAAVTCIAAFIFGMLLALPGSLKPKLAQQLAMREGRVGGFLAALQFALIPSILLGGYLSDLLGWRPMLIIGGLLAAVGVVGLALRRGTLALVGCMVLIAAGAACLGTAVVVMMPTAFDFGMRQIIGAMNLGFVFVALGALMTPTLADLLLRTIDFRKTLAVLSLVCLVPSLLAVLSSHSPEIGADSAERPDVSSVLHSLPILLAGLAFLFYAPLELAISNWGSTYLPVVQGYSERRSAWVMWSFWVAFLTGRVLTAIMFHSRHLDMTWAPAAFFVLALLAAFVLGSLGGLGRPRSAGWGVMALGLMLGPLFPTLVAVVLSEAPNHEYGTAYGAMFAIGSLGSVVLAPVYSVWRQGKNAMGPLVLTPLAVLLVVASLALLGFR
jgi:fucose permease